MNIGRVDAAGMDAHGTTLDAWPLSRAPEAYRTFNGNTDDCTKVVLDPSA